MTTSAYSSPRTQTSGRATYSPASHALLTVTTGNIANRELLALFQKHLDAIVDFLSSAAFVELAHDRLIAHSRERRRE
jgi:hypothetical protein